MAEARDRRVSAEDIAEVYIRRRRSLVRPTNGERVDHGVLDVYLDPPEEETPLRTALRWRRNNPIRLVNGAGEASGRVVRRPMGRGQSFSGLPGGKRASGTILPSWYPRRPLRDITSLVRAIERRRACEGEDQGQSSEGRIPASIAHFEHDISMITPQPTSRRKPFPLRALKVPKILLDITNDNKDESKFMTPQKKLLNSIDMVEKVVMEELNKLKQTSTARKVEREQRVRTLMSMR